MSREVLRALTDREWAVLQPWIERRAKLLAVAQQAEQAATLAKLQVESMVALLAGGADPAVSLDPERRELYRVAETPSP